MVNAYALREPDDFVDWAMVIKDVLTSRFLVVSFADEADFLIDYIGVTIKDDPSRSRSEIADGLGGSELHVMSVKNDTRMQNT